MVHRWVYRLAAMCAAVVALLSVVYAVAYLVITPAAQRGSDSDRFFRSYLAHPAGLRVASVCLAVSGLASAVALVALASRLGALTRPWLGWVSMAAVVAGFATSAHGLGDLLGVDRLAHQYAVGDGATRAAAAVSRAIPAPTDPRGLATFAVAGLVAIVFGATLRPSRGWFGTLGVVLGIDMVVLFVATAVGIHALVLLSGALASVVLGPVWWAGIAGTLWATDGVADVATNTTTTAVASATVASVTAASSVPAGAGA